MRAADRYQWLNSCCLASSSDFCCKNFLLSCSNLNLEITLFPLKTQQRKSCPLYALLHCLILLKSYITYSTSSPTPSCFHFLHQMIFSPLSAPLVSFLFRNDSLMFRETDEEFIFSVYIKINLLKLEGVVSFDQYECLHFDLSRWQHIPGSC